MAVNPAPHELTEIHSRVLKHAKLQIENLSGSGGKSPKVTEVVTKEQVSHSTGRKREETLHPVLTA